MVERFAKGMDVPFRPHDLRCTFAKLAYAGGSPLEQIQLALGHESIATTERYLGGKLNLADAACDRLGIQPYRIPDVASEDERHGASPEL